MDDFRELLRVQLGNFVILGYLHLDGIGHVWSMHYQGDTPEKCAKLPSVITRKEFDQLRHKWHGMYVIDPPVVPRLPCRHCGKPFTLHDIGRMHRTPTYETFDFTPFAGQTLVDVERSFKKMTDVECVFVTPIFVSQEGKEDECQRIDSKLPWVDEIVTREQYVVKSGDRVEVVKWQFEHSACAHQAYKATLDSASTVKSYADFANLLWSGYAFASQKRSPNRGSLERLVFLGRYYSDEFGRCRRFSKDVIPESVRSNLPFMMTQDAFQKALKKFHRSKRFYQDWPSLAPEGGIPSPRGNQLCAGCGNGWTLEDCHDMEVEGWRDESSEDFPISLNSVVWPGDAADLFCYRYYHGPCYRQLQESRVVAESDESFAFIRSLFYAAGFEAVRFFRAPLPMHQRKWLRYHSQNTADAGLNAYRYYRIETTQGYFALLRIAVDWIDLHDTGIRISEIKQGLQSPGNLPPMFTFKNNVDRLVRFRTLLQK